MVTSNTIENLDEKILRRCERYVNNVGTKIRSIILWEIFFYYPIQNREKF